MTEPTDTPSARALPERGPRPASRTVNLSARERYTCAAAGAGLALLGVTRRRKIPGLALILMGAGLLWRGITGHSDFYAGLGIDRSRREAEAEPL